jgi:hypothetical protein
MHRRRFLAAAGTAVALPLAGCSLPVGSDGADPEPLGPPDETTSYEYSRSYRYRVGTAERVTLDVAFGRVRGSLSLETTLTAHDALGHDRFRVTVEPSPSRSGSGTVWVRGVSWASETTLREVPRGTTATVEGDGENGARVLAFRIDREGTSEPVGMRIDAAFGSESGTAYALDRAGTYAVPPPAAD